MTEYGPVALRVVVSVTIGALLLLLVRFVYRRSHVLGLIVATGILLRLVFSLGLFWISYLDLPLLRDLHDGDGFWELAIDARGYYGLATGAVDHGLMTISSSDPSPAFTRALAVWMLLVGVSPASAAYLNVLCYAGLCSAIVCTAWTPRANRAGLLIPLVAYTFSPALLVFGTQSLKDPLFAVLTATAALSWFVAGWPASDVRPRGDRWQSKVVGLGALAVVVYLIAGIRAYYGFLMCVSAAFMFLVTAFQQPSGTLRRHVTGSAAVLGLLWMCLVLGAGPYYRSLALSVFGGAPVAALDVARDSFVRAGGATNVVLPELGTSSLDRVKRELYGLATVFVPISALKALSIVQFQGGRGLLLLTDIDTVFFDALVGCSVFAVVARPRSVRRDIATVCFAVVLGCLTAVLLAYVVTNYGTLFRLRLMVAAPLWLLPIVIAGAKERETRRFTFGRNWTDFSQLLDDERVAAAEDSLRGLVGQARLAGKTFLDIGAGSGLFSIAAARLGAARVVAVDRDEACLTAARQNIQRLLTPEQAAKIDVKLADVLDPRTLPNGAFDTVYAWGSLHHTGALWRAVDNASRLCASRGHIVLAIYNRTWTSPAWRWTKQVYHASPELVGKAMAATLCGTRAIVRGVRGKDPFRTERGMSTWYDAVDWLGGLPYECATAEEVTTYLAERGFLTVTSRPTRRSGCNEFLFVKRA